jgi:hypothetical protein
MRLAEGAYINNIARLEKTEEIEKESAEVDKEIENTPIPEVKIDAEMIEHTNELTDETSEEEAF